MKDVSQNLWRNDHAGFVWYRGGGYRDQYITFNSWRHNTGYTFAKGVQPGFNLGPNPPQTTVIASKHTPPFDYKPDGSGRDIYIQRLGQLKRNYKSDFREFEKSLRSEQSTPIMDTRQIFRRD